MDSPFSPVLADLVMDDLEKDRLSNLDFEVPVYFRYVDDILIMVPNTHVDRILQIFNTNPLNIEFTLEKEVGGAINFLDVSITRKKNQRLSFNWYRKPTWSGRYLNFAASFVFISVLMFIELAHYLAALFRSESKEPTC